MVSTHTYHRNDLTAQAYGVPSEGWLQQVFLATAGRISVVSAVISTHKRPKDPLSVAFQIRTLSDHLVGSSVSKFDGSTDNSNLYAPFGSPLRLRVGALYVLRIANTSQRKIYVYVHRLDGGQVIPYRIAACEFNPLNSPTRQLLVLKNRLGMQVLSGRIAIPGT